jgi:hypothetical protein
MAKTASNLENDDLLLVNRGSSSYNATIQTASDKFTVNLTIFAEEITNPLAPNVGDDSSWNIGQYWYNLSDHLLYVYTAADEWVTVGGADRRATAPTGQKTGDFWLDSSLTPEGLILDELKIYNGNEWRQTPSIHTLPVLP